MTNLSGGFRKILNSSGPSILLAAASSLALALLGLLLIGMGDNAANIGVMLIIVMPGVIGLMLAVHFYGVYAWLWTAAISAISMTAAAKATVGVRAIITLEFLAGPMFIASLVGVVAGILLRPFLRPRRKPG